MRATNTTSIARRAGRLRTAALVGALACASSGAYASVATVAFNALSFSQSAAPGSFLFAPTNTENQAWNLQALTNNVLNQQNTGSVANWNPLTRTAQTAQAKATVSSLVNTDPLTAVETPAFTLTSSAFTSPPGGGTIYTALGNMISRGSLCFWDENTNFDGTSASCTGSGTLELTAFYDLLVNAPSVIGNSAFAELDVAGNGVPNGTFVAISNTAAGIPSKLNQSFTWVQTLARNTSATFTVTGTTRATAVPEPGVMSLAALGLIGLAATRRRHARALS